MDQRPASLVLDFSFLNPVALQNVMAGSLMGPFSTLDTAIAVCDLKNFSRFSKLLKAKQTTQIAKMQNSTIETIIFKSRRRLVEIRNRLNSKETFPIVFF